MKVFIIAAVTADGYIGHDSHEFVDWTGPEDVKLFVRLTKEAGVVVMGSRTFETLQKAGRRLPGRQLIIYTNRPHEISGERIEATAETPSALLTRLADEGVEAVAICGGTSIYDLFLQAGVVTDVYLSITPVLFGKGVSLLSQPINQRLELQSSETLADATIALHYTLAY